jgi:hypothetical protein
VVGQGIILSPASATNLVGTDHTLTATVQDENGNPVAGKEVTFKIVSGPNAGMTGTETTDDAGKAEFTYTGNSEGTDTIVASFIDDSGKIINSNEAAKTWRSDISIPEFPSLSLPLLTIFGLLFAIVAVRRMK